MRKNIIFFALTISIISIILSSYRAGPATQGFDCTGAEAGGTGSYQNPTGCTTGSCHGYSATTTISVAIELDSAGTATTHYKPGTTYTVKITGTNGAGTSRPAYGFQLAVMKGSATAATVSDAGTWTTTGLPAHTRITAPLSPYTYLTVAEHSSSIPLSGTTFSQVFTWTAPATGTGTVSFWGAANFVNGNGNADAGDLWNTSNLVVNEWPAVSATDNVANARKVNVYPNPVTDMLHISTDGGLPGSYTIGVYDINGKVIATETTTAGLLTYVNTAGWQSGLYVVVIGSGEARDVIPVVKR